MKHTYRERRIVELCTEVARAYEDLEKSEGQARPSHRRDVTAALYVVDRIIALRLARRVDPQVWGDP